ncbi:MAG: hypothetical protein GY861_05985 [bacterium]|nr:hypothetical protein [bacterium]
MDDYSKEMPWVIFYLLDGQYAVSAQHVREMVAMPSLTPVPKTPEYVRGVINLRGQVFPVVDLRLKMGMKSFVAETDELIALLTQREQDHKNWLAELELSVREKRDFKLATDPHKCAFGKWYDTFETDNRVMSNCLAKFDAPHQRIHGIAIKVKELVSEGDYDSAYEVINQTREGELAEMIKLFAEIRLLVTDSIHEIALVLEYKEDAIVVSVDSVATVETLVVSEIEEVPEVASTLANECIAGIVKRGGDDDLVQLLDVGVLMSQEIESLVATSA